MYSIEAVTVCASFPNMREIWDLLSDTHPDYIGIEMNVARTDSRIVYEDYGRHLERNNLGDIGADFSNGSIHYGDIPDLKFARLDINDLVLDEADAETWLSVLFTDRRFIQARFYYDDYDTWQNMKDLKYYESENRSYEDLPLKSNGLPFPLEQQIVDISNNPGRWKLQNGYIESVGSVMWLGEQFWKNTGASKEEVLACAWLQVEEIGSAIKLKLQSSPFTSSEGQEGELQNKLRALLYPGA